MEKDGLANDRGIRDQVGRELVDKNKQQEA
jgi:hypothetical protein